MRDTIKAADAIVVVTAEYNHSVPPGLLSMLDHFGGSNFAGKPSGIVTYSPSPWGGARASIAIQPVLHELGALPVSKMVHLPDPAGLLDAQGAPVDADARMLKQLPGMLDQLEYAHPQPHALTLTPSLTLALTQVDGDGHEGAARGRRHVEVKGGRRDEGAILRLLPPHLSV